MGKYFGTDGIRGVANTELDANLAFQVGRAAAHVLTREKDGKACLLIGKDTRLSSDMLEAALVAGICSVGANVELLGVIPTPAIAYLTLKHGADAGIVISASHNPYEYNGIKIFGGNGYKLSDELEEEIERLIDDDGEIPRAQGADLGRVIQSAINPREEYVDYLVSTIPGDLSGLKIAVDCANGASSETAFSCSAGWAASRRSAFTSPMASTSTTTAARPIWRICSSGCAAAILTPASPSTGMPTAAWWWTTPARCWTATGSWQCAPPI